MRTLNYEYIYLQVWDLGFFSEVRGLSCIWGNDAPTSDIFREHSGNWMMLAVIKMNMDTCNLQICYVLRHHRKKQLEEGDCLTLTSLRKEATGTCRRFPLLQVSSEQILP